MNDEFLREHADLVYSANQEHFKKLAFRLLSDFADRYGRRMNDEEYDAMVRWLATEALSLGSFLYGRVGGDLNAAIEYVREEFLRGMRAKTEEQPRDRVEESDATTQD